MMPQSAPAIPMKDEKACPNYPLPFTINAWMTPGIQPMIVRITLIKNVVPRPCFKKTAKGGNKILRMIVSNDIGYILMKILTTKLHSEVGLY